MKPAVQATVRLGIHEQPNGVSHYVVVLLPEQQAQLVEAVAARVAALLEQRCYILTKAPVGI